MDDLDTRFTVFLVDDDPAVRDALALLLSLRGYRTALFACAEDFLGALQLDWAGCVIADIKMPGMSGLDLQQELARRAVALPVVIITAHASVSSARQAFKAAAVDFLEKPFGDEQLMAAIEAAFSLERERLAVAGVRAGGESRIAALSEREREVLGLLAQGLHNREVAERLGISPRTVEVHKARIMAKLDVRNLAELIRVADAATG